MWNANRIWKTLAAVVSVAVMTAVRELLRLLSQRPADQNMTNEELEQHYQRARREEAQAIQMMIEAQGQAHESRRREAEARIREQEANQREQEALQREAEAHRREKEANLAAEQARIAARELTQATMEREEAAKRLEEEISLLVNENRVDELKQATRETQKREEQARVREQEMREREEEAGRALSKAQEQEQKAKKDLERALYQGIQPEVWPTEEEFRLAKTRIQYDPEKLHFAIYGSSGSGKSSLINALRGLTNFDPGAAPTGVTETTMSITRYPDPHEELPHSRFIWFDVPGAGTLNVPGWQYFNQLGLFIFDIIILVYDTASIL